MPNKGIKNIIFDLGNTLLFFDFNYFYNGLANREKRLNIPAFKKFIHQRKYDVKLMKGMITHRDFFRSLKRKFNLKISYSDFIYLYSDIFWINYPMKHFLEKLARIKKFKLFLLSNTDTVHINFIDKNYPFTGIIKNRILSFRVKSIKPEKKIFNCLIKRYRIEPHESVMIDDMKDNLITAHTLGFHTILYRNHKKFIKEFSRILSPPK
ncbi:MAG: HAD-IA family hydrolase [Ignavibacteria bacterium]